MVLSLTLVPCSIVFYWVSVVMHCGFYQWHFEVNQRDLNTVHHYETMNHVRHCYFVYCDNIRPLDMMIAWHFLWHLSNQLDPNTNHVQCHLNPNGFEYAIQLMSFQHIVKMLQPPLVAISPVAIAAFWRERVL